MVGCGGAGRLHLGALERAGLRPAALVEPDAERRAALAQRWPGVPVGPTAAAVAGAFDAAIVAVPDRAHAPVALELLRAGAHVLVEKPMAGTRADAAAMVATAAATDRTLAVAHVRRHLAALRWSHELLRSGQLGAVERIDVAQGGLDHWWAASSGYVVDAVGGVIADQAAHSIDLLGWWFGALDVRACTDDGHGGQEADAVIELDAGGVPVRLEVSRIRARRNTIRVWTERGLLEVALDHYQPRQVLAVPEGLDVEPLHETTGSLDDQFDHQLRAFCSALDGDWPSTLATAVDGAAVVGVVEDCYALRRFEEPPWMRSAVTGP